MAATMGFSSFGAQDPPSRKRKYNPNNDAVISIGDGQLHGTGANTAPVGERRAPPPTNADEIDLDVEDGNDDAKNHGETTPATESATLPVDANSKSSPSIGAGIAGLPQRPAPPPGGFAGHQHQRGGAPRQAGGHRDRNKLWYQDYYDHFSNENPWAKLEEAAGLSPISTWDHVHMNKGDTQQAA
ncbi:hypothetical protein ISF_04960 [Cordyceps fumosorosea ARSEF 2679]|uniref:Uncharacterized protein n=1 Tax=Cordyceps fumosorosea (strain ARSEF 2679) TaxID=1081104 RepID=A0A167VXE0_CORFA|nr:hypothetical protein ISF_04960 [Cordyceps fumosorosea ARSEF 2679]OAA63084.1 hypothetical protein ISF_04960 [Cordyceps fumosorosea ARSEF 2679]